MKKNFLIMMIMLLCSGFAFAQINTVRGFVPGAGTGAGNNDQTYAVFGQMFGNIDLNAANPYEVAEGLGQAQLIADTVEAVVGCGDSLIIDEFTLSVAAIQTIVDEFADDPTRPRDTFLTIQHPNAAIYNYDKLLVLHLFVCPCTIKDADTHEYEVVAIDNICWTKTNMRATTTCGGIEVVTKSYSTDVTPELNDSIFGLLYTWENASKASKCDSNYVTGICPCGWHLPTAAEVDTILNSYTNDLRSNGGYWVVPQGITNLTKFTAEPAGYFDSLATRFEGFHSEADFWYVATDSTCDADYFQIYYFCDKPKHEPRNVNTDAMSVRCVLDMIYDYHKDDPNPNPTPTPTPPTTDCPFTVSEVYPKDNGYAVNVQNTDVFKAQEEEVYFLIFDATGGDPVDQIDGTLSTQSEPGSTTVTYYVAAPDLVDYPEATSYKIVFRFNLKDDYFECANNDGAYESTKVVTIPGTEPSNTCPTYGTVNIVNNQYKIAVGNYTPSTTTQDVFTVTCVYDIGSVGQSQIVERTGNIYYDNGFVYIGLGNDVPADYCGLTFIIKLNGACEKSLLYSYCH